MSGFQAIFPIPGGHVKWHVLAVFPLAALINDRYSRCVERQVAARWWSFSVRESWELKNAQNRQALRPGGLSDMRRRISPPDRDMPYQYDRRHARVRVADIAVSAP